MNELKWRFPLSSGGEFKGISSGDEETFKEFPFKAFARELLQNSIDVRYSDEEPVRIEFAEFELNKNEIPGIFDYLNALKRCKELWSSKEDYEKIYQKMIDYVESNDVFPCLRISDMNTTGLIGIETNELEENNYLALIKGTGFSSKKKGVLTGGSKGVGKNASFLLSKLKMVFYSTKTDNSQGTIGVTKLVSGYANNDSNSKKRALTQGTGFYSIGEECNPSYDILNIDPNFLNRKMINGTDVFVIGMQKSDKWDKEIIKEIISSFMVAIKEKGLEVSFNGMEINSNTLPELMELDYLKLDKSIVAQFDILYSETDIHVFDISTELGTCTLYLKAYTKQDEAKATNKCFMVRHPGMLIKASNYANYNISALCKIKDDTLGKTLLSIENPQHTSWQVQRIADPYERREVKNCIVEIDNQINDCILSVLQSGESIPIDPLGAGDYLPDIDEGNLPADSEGEKSKASNDDVIQTAFKENVTHEKNANEEAEDGNGLQPVEGSAEEGGNDVEVPVGHNDKHGGGSHPGIDPKGLKEGDSILFKNAKLKGVRYKVISIDKNVGKIRVVLISPINADNCYLSLNMLDDHNSPTEVQIIEMKNNDVQIESKDKLEFGPFEIKENSKIVLDVKTNINGFFGCGVKIICK